MRNSQRVRAGLMALEDEIDKLDSLAPLESISLVMTFDPKRGDRASMTPRFGVAFDAGEAVRALAMSLPFPLGADDGLTEEPDPSP